MGSLFPRGPSLHKASGHTVYAPQAAEKRALFLSVERSASDPDVVAHEIMKAVLARRPKTRYAVGAYAQPSIFISTFLPDRAIDWMMSRITRNLLDRQCTIEPSPAA